MAYGDFEQFYYGGEIKLLAQSRAKCLALSAFFFLNSFWVRVEISCVLGLFLPVL